MSKPYKICYINGWASGSTGNIVKNISRELENMGFESCFISKEDFGKDNSLRLGCGKLSSNALRLWTRLKGNDGFTNSCAIHKLFSFLDEQKPDLICIHNVHFYFLNIDHVFRWSKKNGIPIVWVLHDCWTLTGRCGYPLFCDKWLYGCKKCEHKEYYPRTVVPSNTGHYWEKRRKLIASYENVIFCPVSDWLNSEFQKAYPNAKTVVMKNPLDLDVFYNEKATLTTIKTFANDRIIVGAASDFWTKEKGLLELVEFANLLDSKKYAVVCAGKMPNDCELPKNLLSLGRLNGKQEMSKFFKSLDCFVNFTLMDTCPSVNIEALASGIPVLSFDSGGACSAILDGKNGYVISLRNVSTMISKLKQIDSLSFEKKEIADSTADYRIESASQRYASLFLNILEKK